MTSMYKSRQCYNVARKHAFSLSFALFFHPVCRLPAANSAICSGAHTAQSLESVSTPTQKKECEGQDQRYPFTPNLPVLL